MPLLELWKSSPDTISGMSLEQIVKIAGDGSFRDKSETSKEFREYISQISREKIECYVNHCLGNSFPQSGLVLQDLVNELGRRLEYKVEDGLYQGTKNSIGFDGIWRTPEGNALVIEVKTTDTYRINLDVIANYRSRLIRDGSISDSSSLLLVVGRQDTGDIEAQIRGSRHAWDIRIISVESLLKIVSLKEDSGNEDTLRKIRSLLVPVEYTRLDNIIDVMFATATDVSSVDDVPADSETEGSADTHEETKYKQVRTDINIIRSIRNGIVDSYGKSNLVNLIAKSRALFWTSDKSVRVACTISKRYERGADYWYAFHKKWFDFLKEGKTGVYILGFVDQPRYIAIPVEVMAECLGTLHKTNINGNLYWHIWINQTAAGFSLQLPGTGELELAKYTRLLG